MPTRGFPPSGSATSLFTSPAEVPSTRTLSFLRIKSGKRQKWKQDGPTYLLSSYVFIQVYIYMYTYVYILLYHISKTLYTYVSTYTYLCLEITIRVSHVLYVLNRPNRYACACILSSSHHHHHHHNNNNNNKNHQVWCPPTPPRLILQRFFPKALLRSGASLAKYCLKKSKTSKRFQRPTRHRWVGC